MDKKELLRFQQSKVQVFADKSNSLKDEEGHVVSKAKTDSLDASCLADLLRTDRHRFKPLALLPEDYRLLDRLCLALRKLVGDRTRVVNQINDCLKEFYPQALGLFYKTDGAISIAFLETFSDPNTLHGRSCGEQRSLVSRS